jgi:hypothetical protein
MKKIIFLLLLIPTFLLAQKENKWYLFVNHHIALKGNIGELKRHFFKR